MVHYSHGQLNYPIYAYAQSYMDGHIEDLHHHERVHYCLFFQGDLCSDSRGI